jgi:MoxR-like ATPase
VFASLEEASSALAGTGYLPSREIATAVFLADRLEKPILVEGPAGVGKTELGRAFAQASGRALVRLQCYEGLDEAKALYEWEYAKQLLYTQLLKDRLDETLRGASSLAEAAARIGGNEGVFFSERFLLPRPILKAIRADAPAVLLIDEIDMPTRSSRPSFSRSSPTSRSPSPSWGPSPPASGRGCSSPRTPPGSCPTR